MKSHQINQQKAFDEERNDENSDFEDQREKFNFVSTVIGEARKLFKDNLQTPALIKGIKLSCALHTINPCFNCLMKNVKKSNLQPIQQQFVNQDLTGRIIQLMDDLQNQLQQSQDDNSARHIAKTQERVERRTESQQAACEYQFRKLKIC